MELDSLKKSWQELGGIVPPMDEAKIQRMINNQGQGAYSSLVRSEQIMIVLLIVIMPLSFVFKDNLLSYIYTGSVAIGLIWQLYKYRFIKNIDFSKISLIEISSKINRYKKYLIREIAVNSAWAFLFIALWIIRVVYKDLLKTSLDYSTLVTILIAAYIIIVFLAIGIAMVFYKKYASRNIKKIEESIEEIKELENDK